MLRKYTDRKLCIVNLKSGTSFRGIVWGHKNPYLIIKQAVILQSLEEKTTPTPVDGEVLVLLNDVDFIQIING